MAERRSAAAHDSRRPRSADSRRYSPAPEYINHSTIKHPPLRTASGFQVPRLRRSRSTSRYGCLPQHCLHDLRPAVLYNNNNNNNNNNRISIAPYGRNFRGAGGRSDQCSVKAWLNKNVFKSVRESLMRTVCGSELQIDCAENRKSRLEKSVLMNGWNGRWT